MRIFEFDDVDRDLKNFLHVNIPFAHEAFEMADEVEGELVQQYKREHGIKELKMGEYGPLATKIRNQIGTLKKIPINKIISSEEYLHSSHLEALKDKNTKTSSEHPLLYKYEGKFVVGDGNHRIAYAHKNNETQITALVVDLDKLSKELNVEI